MSFNLLGQLDLESLGIVTADEKKGKAQKAQKESPKKQEKQKEPPKKQQKEPLKEDAVVSGKLVCPPLTFDVSAKSVPELRKVLEERGFLEAVYYKFFQFGSVVLAVLPYESTVSLNAGVDSKAEVVRFGDAFSLPEDESMSYSILDLKEGFEQAYPEYKGSAMIQLADDVYAPLPGCKPGIKGVTLSLDGDTLIPESCDSLEAVVTQVLGISEKLIPVEVRGVVAAGKLVVGFFYKAASREKNTAAASKKAEQMVKLPVKVVFTFGVAPQIITPEDFNGKNEVELSAVKELVQEKYTAFKTVKSDFCYMENVPIAGTDVTENLIQVMVYMQGKGAFFPTFETCSLAKEYVESGRGDAARFLFTHQNGREENGKVQRVPSGIFTLYPHLPLKFQLFQMIPKEILAELVRLFREALPFEDAARVYRRSDGTFFVHHLEATVRTRSFVNFEDLDQPREAQESKAALFCEVHSHNTMPAFFSQQDFVSAVYPGLYVCIGRLDLDTPQIACCAQMDWKTVQLRADDVFEGCRRSVDTEKYAIKTYTASGDVNFLRYDNNFYYILQLYVQEAKRNPRCRPTLWVFDGSHYVRVHDYTFSELTSDNVYHYLQERIIEADDLLDTVTINTSTCSGEIVVWPRKENMQ